MSALFFKSFPPESMYQGTLPVPGLTPVIVPALSLIQLDLDLGLTYFKALPNPFLAIPNIPIITYLLIFWSGLSPHFP